ncbi:MULTISPECIES: class I SAM-dependent methyltransferase [Streptomyces]|uniref:Methyltransferase domain-containing protein n=1 Tax=Streptomyces melanosporofaciens TaxID=67327 RepID=A0A1H4T0U2_STRMJ|nr:class I SAM-dependent methyltransferase [Streptomyces melanosporofaciens]SEC50065.1 Methyltransferase domain-containing protein [Streptomyces melanosporofaciens]
MTDHHHHHHNNAADEDEWGESAMAELLDLDAEVLHTFLSEATAVLAQLTRDEPLHRILDLGSGTGAGTLALLQRFEGAEAIAVDRSPRLLDHLRGKARARGVEDRVRTVQADLDAAWPEFGAVNLVWASASLHHLTDPDRGLRQIFESLRPGGLLAVIEMAGFPRFLPDDVGRGRPGLEARCHAARAEAHAESLPDLGSDWGPRLSAAGFTVEVERPFTIDLRPPLPESVGRYAQASLGVLRSRVAEKLSSEDLATLDHLIDSDSPDGVVRRDDLTVRAERTLWAARRP